MMKDETTTEEGRFQDFQHYLRRQHLSEHTITAYVGGIRTYLRLYCGMSPENLGSYKQYLLGHYRPATVNLRICGMNRYLCYLEEMTSETLCPMYRLPTVKLQVCACSPRTISNADYERMKRGLWEDGNLYWYVLVHLLAGTGARISELLQIRVEDLSYGYMDLYTKGEKARRIYIPDCLCREALEWCGGIGHTSGFLFQNDRGRLITDRGVRWKLKQLAVLYQVDPTTVYPHAFRHRFAQNFLQRFNDISLLADLLGHENIETTRVYLKKTSSEQQQLIDEKIRW
ncbi:MAG: tyrosine-type recombinase/integrase [Hungatella sp.]